MAQIGQKLTEAREKKGITIDEIADQIGLSSRAYRYYEEDRSFPKMNKLLKICEILELKIEDLLNKDEQTVPSKPTGKDIREQKAFGDNEEGIPVVPISAQAGYTQHYLDPVFVKDLDTMYMPNMPYKGDKYRMFEVSGDSMEPTLKEHYYVICEKIEPEYWDGVANFYIHVVVTIDRIMIKRIFKKDDETFVLISDNKDFYPQFTMKKKDIKELWVVKRKIDWEMPPPQKFEITA